MTVGMDERLDILQNVSKSWLELMKTIKRTTDDQATKPGMVGDWSIKDVMAHITFWESRLIDEIGILDAGGTPPAIDDFEAVNREEAAKSRGASLDEVKARFETVHDQMMTLLEVTPFLSRELVAGSTYEHYDEHLHDIQAARAK